VNEELEMKDDDDDEEEEEVEGVEVGPKTRIDIGEAKS